MGALPYERTRAMVVEDDDALSSLLRTVLEEEGYEIRCAPDGAQAVAVLESWHPDVILLDLRMPRMDGWRFRDAQRARSELRDIPVVVVSAVANLPEQAAGLDAAAVLAKPFELDALLAAVGRSARRS
jgi:CheY-like chemotaxis protein